MVNKSSCEKAIFPCNGCLWFFVVFWFLFSTSASGMSQKTLSSQYSSIPACHINVYLNQTPISNYVVRSTLECALVCSQLDDCLSFHAFPLAEGDFHCSSFQFFTNDCLNLTTREKSRYYRKVSAVHSSFYESNQACSGTDTCRNTWTRVYERDRSGNVIYGDLKQLKSLLSYAPKVRVGVLDTQDTLIVSPALRYMWSDEGSDQEVLFELPRTMERVGTHDTHFYPLVSSLGTLRYAIYNPDVNTGRESSVVKSGLTIFIQYGSCQMAGRPIYSNSSANHSGGASRYDHFNSLTKQILKIRKLSLK